MKSVGYILWGLVAVSLISTIFKPSMIWVAAPLLALALSYSLFRICLYRPPEDHLGVIYQFARFSRLVGPDQWVFIIPGLNEIKDPISLHLRRVAVNLADLLTQDQIPLDCKLLVYYQLDLRCAAAGFPVQALRIPDEGWNSIIRNVLQETANEVTSGIAFQQLLTPRGRRHFKWTLGALLAERVRHLGLVINPRTGVSMQMLKPAHAIWQAMVDRLAAVSLGEAALARVHPILEDLSRRQPETAWEALLLEWAAVAAKDGTVPQVLVAPTGGPAHAVPQGRDQFEPNDQPYARATVLDLRSKRKTNMPSASARVSRATSH